MSVFVDLALAVDPAQFARRAALEPDDWQADLLCSDARQAILLCARQTGKSTTSAVLATHEAEYRPGSLVLLLSPSLRQSQELFRKVRDVRAALSVAAFPVAEESALRLELVNGSRIICLPGSEQTIRGYSGVRLLVVDEASRVPDELYQAVRPMLAVSGGRLVLLSTPFGRRGFFYHEWMEGGSTWQRVRITARECPRIPPDWLEAERATIGEWWFKQEYECEFVETLDQIFGFDLIQRALKDDVHLLWEGDGGL